MPDMQEGQVGPRHEDNFVGRIAPEDSWSEPLGSDVRGGGTTLLPVAEEAASQAQQQTSQSASVPGHAASEGAAGGGAHANGPAGQPVVTRLVRAVTVAPWLVPAVLVGLGLLWRGLRRRSHHEEAAEGGS